MFVASQRRPRGWNGGMESGLVRKTQEAGQMAPIVTQSGLPGLLVVIERAGRSLALVIVVAEVLRGFVLLVPAIVGDRGPGYLEREQAQHEEQDKAAHGQHSNLLTSHFGNNDEAGRLMRVEPLVLVRWRCDGARRPYAPGVRWVSAGPRASG